MFEAQVFADSGNCGTCSVYLEASYMCSIIVTVKVDALTPIWMKSRANIGKTKLSR